MKTVVWRTILVIGCFLFLGLAGYHLAAVFGDATGPQGTDDTRDRPLDWAIGITAAGLFILSINEVFKGRECGPVDFILPRGEYVVRPSRLSVWIVAMFAVWCFVGQHLAPYMGSWAFFVYHTDADTAVESLADSPPGNVNNHGQLLVWRDKANGLRATQIKPDLIRGLLSRGIDINADASNELATPLPGWLPLILLVVWPSFAADRLDLARGRIVLGTGLINFYLVFWFVAAQIGLFTVDGGLHPETVAGLIKYASLSAILLGSIYFKVDQADEAKPMSPGWTWFFVTLQTFTLLGAFWFGVHISMPIVIVWGLVYTAAMLRSLD